MRKKRAEVLVVQSLGAAISVDGSRLTASAWNLVDSHALLLKEGRAIALSAARSKPVARFYADEARVGGNR